jgi:hypothetical protein
MSGPRKTLRRSTWIEILFKRRTGSHALRTGFLLNQEQNLLNEEAHAHVHGRESLRRAALEELESSLSDTVAFALVILSVVGEQEDLSHAEGLLNHPVELVRKAAKACRFQLRRRSSVEK